LLCETCNESKGEDCCCKVHNKRLDVNSCDTYSSSNVPTTSNTTTTRSVSNTTTTRSTSNVSTSTRTSSRQCTGYTQKGARCRNMTTNSNGRCYLH
jgi:hypothetical protein